MKLKVEDREMIIIPESPQDEAYLSIYFGTVKSPKIELKPMDFPAKKIGGGVYTKTCLVISSYLKEFKYEEGQG